MSRASAWSVPWLAAVAALALSLGLFGVARAQLQEGGEGVAPPAVAAPSAQPQQTAASPDTREAGDYDPWEPFNEKTFEFNHDVFDHYLLKPVATVWSKAIPERVRASLAHALNNLGMPRRLVNELLQGRFDSASGEVARFLLNSVFGVAGFFDVAADMGLKGTDADTGQTLGVYGLGPGPYLVLPLLPPLTVRDGIGYGVDSFLDPLSYFIPFLASLGRGAAQTINERAANLKVFQDVEEVALDLYGAVRNGYLQRRQRSIEDALAERKRQESDGLLATLSNVENHSEEVELHDEHSGERALEKNQQADLRHGDFICDEDGDYCVPAPDSRYYMASGGYDPAAASLIQLRNDLMDQAGSAQARYYAALRRGARVEALHLLDSMREKQAQLRAVNGKLGLDADAGLAGLEPYYTPSPD